MGRVFDIREPRNSHVTRLRPTALLEPTLCDPAGPVLFDQDAGLGRVRSDDMVSVTRAQAAAIVGLLAQAKQSRLMNVEDVSTAMSWLSPHPSLMGPRGNAS